MGNRWVRDWLIKGTKKDRKTGKIIPYKVSQREDGIFGCDCPNWINCPAPKDDCKHILRVKLMLLQGTPGMGSLAASMMKRVNAIAEPELVRAICLDE